MTGHQGVSTRARIQQVSLELFGEQGYEKTSLREVADRLNVSKAALYYHFKTKEDILLSCVEDLMAELDEIIEWGRTRPATDDTRHELVDRYGEVVLRRASALRFFQQNPASERASIGSQFKDRMTRLTGLLADPDGPLEQRIRALAAIASLHIAVGVFEDGPYTREQVADAALAVSRELVTTRSPAEGP